MSGNTNYWIDSILKDIYVEACSNDTKEFWVGLSSSMPTADGSEFSEPSTEGTNYTRQKITSFTLPYQGQIKNANTLNFSISTRDWFVGSSQAEYWLLFDSETHGNLLSWGKISNPQTITSNTTVSIPENSIVITLTTYDS